MPNILELLVELVGMVKSTVTWAAHDEQTHRNSSTNTPAVCMLVRGENWENMCWSERKNLDKGSTVAVYQTDIEDGKEKEECCVGNSSNK